MPARRTWLVITVALSVVFLSQILRIFHWNPVDLTQYGLAGTSQKYVEVKDSKISSGFKSTTPESSIEKKAIHQRNNDVTSRAVTSPSSSADHRTSNSTQRMRNMTTPPNIRKGPIEPKDKHNKKQRTVYGHEVRDRVAGWPPSEHFKMHTFGETPPLLYRSSEKPKDNFTVTMETRQLVRHKIMEDACKKRNRVPSLLPSRFKRIFVDDRNKFMYCLIFKVASSSFRKTLANNSGVIDAAKVTSAPINDESFLHKIGLKYLSGYSMPEINYRLNNYFKFIIVRDPLKRLLSAFRDRFENSRDKSYYLKHYGRQIVRKYRKKFQRPFREVPNIMPFYKRKNFFLGSDVKFEEFLQFVADRGLHGAQLNYHWNTFDECRPCTVDYDYIAKLETYEEDVSYILKHISNKPVPPVSDQFGPSSKKSNLQTNDAYHQYYSKVPKSVINNIRQVYGFDCKSFGYSCTVGE